MLRQVHDPHAAFAELLKELILADDRARPFREGDLGLLRRRHRGVGQPAIPFQVGQGNAIGSQQPLHPGAQTWLVSANLLEKRRLLGRLSQLRGLVEDEFHFRIRE